MDKVLELTFKSNVIYLSHILAKICGKMKWQMVYGWEGHHFSGIFNNSLIILYQFEFLKIILFFQKKMKKKRFYFAAAFQGASEALEFEIGCRRASKLNLVGALLPCPRPYQTDRTLAPDTH